MPPDDYDTALSQLLELTVLLTADMNQRFERDGLTAARTHLIWELQQRGPSTQRALAQAMDVSPRNITGLVDALVDTGFVMREPHPTDRRATLVTFTEHGSAAATGLERDQEELSRLLFDAMPDDEFRGFVKGLDAVLTRLRELIAADAAQRAKESA